MDENKLRRLLTRMTALVVAVCLILLLITGVIVAYSIRSLRDYMYEQMQAEAQEYKKRIFRQMDSDFQLLHSLAAFLELSDVAAMPRQAFADGLYQINAANDFVSIAYFAREGEGVIDTLGYGTEADYPLAACNEDVKKAVMQSMQGEDAVSRMFESEVSDGRVYVYSVPVYEGDQVVGVLAASDHLDIFADILDGDTVLGGNGYIHMIGSEGKFLVRSERSIVKESGLSSIFDGPYIPEDEEEELLSCLARQESVFSSFRYEGQECLFYLEPVGLNGWYLFCANTVSDAGASLYPILLAVGIAFFLVLALAVFLLFYGYSQVRKSNTQLVRLAYYDALTGAENALRFSQKLEGCQQQAEEYSILALNIRHFKFYNEIFGKKMGDRLLCDITQAIRADLGEGEFFCREAADLFYLLIRDTKESSIRARFGCMVQQIKKAALGERNRYALSLYCGVAVKGGMMQALLAQQSIKNTYTTAVAFYDEALHEKERRKNRIESHMQAALESGEFKLFLQPKMDLRTGALAGAEALVRWQTEDGSILYPGDFIPLFESNGFCAKLDLYMVERVCAHLRAWLDAGIPPVPISVNQSKLLFYEGDYMERLESLVHRYRVPPRLITLEILEGLAAEHLEDINARIAQLHDRGFRVSMDDFGSGYSSLNTLCQLKIDELKLDQGFLRRASREGDARRFLILEQIVELARKLGLSTVAEGVETQEDADLMRRLGCQYGQGYHYSRPICDRQFDSQYMEPSAAR